MSLVPNMNFWQILFLLLLKTPEGRSTFEIGVRAPVFIGSPFHPFLFSLVFKRVILTTKSVSSYQLSKTAMIDGILQTNGAIAAVPARC
jgi:hypothetical protein